MITPIGKFIEKNHDVRHVECGNGQLAIDGVGYQDFPLGFGFRGSAFVVDKMRVKIYKGFCMDCHKEGYFAEKGKGKMITVKPKSVNKKIKEAKK